MLGGLRRLALEDVVQISYSWRPALTVMDAEGNVIEVPRLFGGIRAIAESIASAASARGVRIERVTPPRAS
jgi:phytoene dehydrogenase-like protein